MLPTRLTPTPTPPLQCDIAMLTVDDDEFWVDVVPLEINGLPAMQVRMLAGHVWLLRFAACVCCPGLLLRCAAWVCCLGLLLRLPTPGGWQYMSYMFTRMLPPAMQEAVMVVGFPTGGDNVCVTKGVVSRIDR
jgi:hypothetical protein